MKKVLCFFLMGILLSSQSKSQFAIELRNNTGTITDAYGGELLSTAPASLLGIDPTTGIYKYSLAGIKAWLGIPAGGETLQSITERGNTTSHNLAIGGSSLRSYDGYNVLAINSNSGGGLIDFRNAEDKFHIRYGILTGLTIESRSGTQPILLQPVYGGNVGIGTTSPGYKLDVVSAIDALSVATSGAAVAGLFQNTGGHSTIVRLMNTGNFTDIQKNIDGSLSFDMNDGEVMRFNSDGNVGIGTASPGGRLAIAGVDNTHRVSMTDGIVLSNMWCNGNYFNISTETNSPIRFYPGASQTSLTLETNGNVGIGVTDTKGYKLAVAGNTVTEKLIVKKQESWPDYVFDSSYQLASLHQVEKFIQENKHLPEVPSATDVKKEGLDLGDNQAILLKKIEELTLYIIGQNKKIEQQEQRMLELERRVNK